MMASASDVFDSQVDKLVLTRTVNPTASAMFQIGAGLVQSSRGLVLVPLAVMLAGTAELYRSDPHRLRRLETLADSSVQAIAAITAGGLVLFAVPFVETWLGPGYGDAALCVQVLALAALINAWSAPWTCCAIGRGGSGYVLISAGVTLAVNAAATIILTSRIGLNGAFDRFVGRKRCWNRDGAATAAAMGATELALASGSGNRDSRTVGCPRTIDRSPVSGVLARPLRMVTRVYRCSGSLAASHRIAPI